MNYKILEEQPRRRRRLSISTATKDNLAHRCQPSYNFQLRPVFALLFLLIVYFYRYFSNILMTDHILLLDIQALILPDDDEHSRVPLPLSSLMGRPSEPSASSNSIPHILFFTFSKTYHDTPKELRDNVDNSVRRYRKLWNEPSAPFYYLTDEDCQAILMRVYPSLVKHFKGERQGMYKSDICRVAVLYEFGGYYHDVDMRVVQAVPLHETTEFSTVYAAELSTPTSFFQSFLASRKQHPILYEALKRIEQIYREGVVGKNGFLGTTTLFDAYHGLNDSVREHTQLFNEANLDDNHTSVLYPASLHGRLARGVAVITSFITMTSRTIFFFSRLPLPRRPAKALLGDRLMIYYSTIPDTINTATTLRPNLAPQYSGFRQSENASKPVAATTLRLGKKPER
jgi:mannosyltransferase OCH1-like enzyme